MGVNCCKQDSFDDVTPCELNDDNLAVVIATDELEHADAMKGRT